MKVPSIEAEESRPGSRGLASWIVEGRAARPCLRLALRRGLRPRYSGHDMIFRLAPGFVTRFVSVTSSSVLKEALRPASSSLAGHWGVRFARGIMGAPRVAVGLHAQINSPRVAK